MKNCVAVFLLSMFGQVSILYAQQANMLADINPTTGSLPKEFTSFRDAVYFAANDGSRGEEVWKYVEGEGATLAFDLIEGETSSRPFNFTVYQDKLYFTATHGSLGDELWVYDGENDPELVVDLNPGLASSSPVQVLVYQDLLLFRTTTFEHEESLWVYDGEGEPVGFHAYFGIEAPFIWHVSDVVAFEEQLFLRGVNAAGGTQAEYYLFDGEQTLRPTKGLNAEADWNGITCAAAYNGDFYLSINNGWYDTPLWKYDGENNLQEVDMSGLDIAPGLEHVTSMQVYQDQLYMNVNRWRVEEWDDDEYTLWALDEVGELTKVLDWDVYFRMNSFSLLNIWDNKLSFAGWSQQEGHQIFAFDGDSTRAISDLNTLHSTRNLQPVGRYLYFSAAEPFNNYEPWRLIPDTTTGVDESAFLPWTCYPNPVEDALTIGLGRLYGSIEVSWMDALGQMVQQQHFDSSDQIVSTHTGASGIYFVRVVAEDRYQKTYKVVKR